MLSLSKNKSAHMIRSEKARPKTPNVLIGALLLLPPLALAGPLCRPAQAGSFVTTYSGGTGYGETPSGPGQIDFGPYDIGWGGAFGGGLSSSATGTVDYYFTWVPASGQTYQSDPPPQNVTITLRIKETAHAVSYGQNHSVNGHIDGFPDETIDDSGLHGFISTVPLTVTPVYGGPQEIGVIGDASTSLNETWTTSTVPSQATLYAMPIVDLVSNSFTGGDTYVEVAVFASCSPAG